MFFFLLTSPYTLHTLCKFHMVCIFQPPKIWWQTSVEAWSLLFDFPTFWIASKEIFLLKNNYNQTMQNFSIEKKFWKKDFFSKKFALYIEWHLNTYISIYLCLYVLFLTYEHKWVWPILHKYIGHYFEGVKIY